LASFNPAKPLDKPSKEHFAQMVADMVPVADAYQRAGYKGNEFTRSQLRRSPDVDARVKWLLADRVRAQTETRQRGEKKIVDARLRLMREFERVAYSSLGDVVAWDRKPVLADDGSVQGYADELVTTPSRRLGPDKMAAIKSVTTKAGNLKIEYHDKLNAMNGLAKILGMTVDASPAPSVTVNTINIGEEKALEVARRLAFLLGNAAPAGPLIEGEAVKTGDKSE
jgi:hypothetical protein